MKPNIVSMTQRKRERFANKINNAWEEGVQNYFQIGRYLIEAKDTLEHGQFEHMIKNELTFSPEVGRCLMVVARHEDDFKTRPGRVLSDLPSSFRMLYELTKLPRADLIKYIEDGTINAKIDRKAVRALVAKHKEHNVVKLKRAEPPKPVAPPPPAQPSEDIQLLVGEWKKLATDLEAAKANKPDRFWALMEIAASLGFHKLSLKPKK